MAAALENFWSRRQARLGHDRLENHEGDNEEEPQPAPSSPAAPTAPTVINNENSSDSDNETRRRAPRREEMVIITNRRPSTDRSEGLEVLTNEGMIVVDPEAMTIQLPQRSTSQANVSNTVSLEELQEERELARRRTGACVLCAVFVLFLLWIEALTNGDFGQLLLCLVGTSWTARWIRHNREREEELDRRIALYLEHAEPGTTELNRSDLRLLSFQAQLALAIMESQRQMSMGGYGHPDGGNVHPGVSNEARQRWERFTYKTVPPGDAKPSSNSPQNPSNKKGVYGSVPQQKRKADADEEAQCSICLSEYDEGDHLVCLPCRHVYHEECVSSWTSNHTRCPLCNFDLESVADTASAARGDISIV
jgi:hypothetical protein